MSYLIGTYQVTLADVRARCSSREQDPADLVAEMVDEPTGDADADLATAIAELHDPELDEDGLDPAWAWLRAEKRHVAHPRYSPWVNYMAVLRATPERRQLHRYSRHIRPLGVRTLGYKLGQTSWDCRYMPSDELGAVGTIERLVLMEKEFIVSKTTGGDEFLDCEDPDARALVPLATTVASVLSEPYASHLNTAKSARVVRADVYEALIDALGCGKYFQVVRRVLELDHPQHISMRIAWPTPSSPIRDLGILEYRGQRMKYLHLSAPALRKLE